MKKIVYILTFIVFQYVNAATVTKISKNSKKITVTMDSEDEFSKGDIVCVRKANNKKIVCGKIYKTKKTKAYFKVKSKKRLARVKNDMLVNSKNSSSAASSFTFNMYGLYLLKTVATANPITYKIPENATPETLWDENVSEAKHLGVVFDFEVPISKMALIIGFRYQLPSNETYKANIVATSLDPYVSTNLSTSAFGGFLDFRFLTLELFKGFYFNPLAGLDFNMSTAELFADKIIEGQDNVELAAIESKLMVLSLRAVLSFEYKITKMFNIRFGTDLLVPVLELSKTESGEVGITETNADKIDDQLVDAVSKLNHRKESFAYDIFAGVGISF